MTNNNQKQFYIFKSISLLDKYNFFEYLSIMLDGGITVVAALDSVKSKIKNAYFLSKITELQTYITSGDSLSKSMKKMPDVFGASEYSIIEAGEQSGTLVNALSTISGEFKKLHELKSKIKSALTYPIIIILFLILAVLIVMTYVIPKIIPLFLDFNTTLPFATQALIGTSNFITNNFILLIFISAFGIFMIYGYMITASGKRFFDNLFLNIPLIGILYKNYLISTISSNLGTLMGGGVPIIKSLILIGKTTNNTIYEELFDEISKKVGEGKKLVESILETDVENRYFPADFIQMLSVGERTASIEKVCKKLNNQYSQEVEYSLANLTKWIEPIAILIAGVFVLWFAFAIFGAILELTQSIG